MHGGDIYNNRVDLDLSVNLNPYTDEKIRKRLEKAYTAGLDAGAKYPDIDQTGLRNALSEYEGVAPECIFAGSGASQMLMAAVTAINPRCALLTEPSFSGYRHALDAIVRDEGGSGHFCEIRQHFLKEEDGFALTADVLGQLTDDVDVLFLTDPNNPTGRNIDRDLLFRILDKAVEKNIDVVLDESFYTISEGYDRGRSVRLIAEYDNLFIIRSFTKSFALPGVRMGYVLSSPDRIAKLRGHLPEWNLPALSEAVMEECARISRDEIFYDRSMDLIRKERGFLSKELSERGFTVFDSDAVFLLVKGREGLYEKLLDKGILIRRCDDFEGLDPRFYRIAVRTHEENVHLIETLKQ